MQHDFHLEIIKKLHKIRVTFICGTDAGIGVTVPRFSINRELPINASKTHLIVNNKGTIEVGKFANLIRIDNNPSSNLSTLKNPKTVFIKRRDLDRKTLDNFENNARNRNNLIASAARYLENLIVKKKLVQTIYQK
jgi:hypothetical protein